MASKRTTQQEEEEFQLCWRQHPHKCHRRRFVVTEGGYYCLAPDLVKVGDHCVGVAGTDYPFLMRPTRKNENEYKIIGEMYMHEFDREAADREFWDQRISVV